MSTASLVLGIVSLVLVFVPGFNFLGLIAGIIGIVLGSISLKNSKALNQPQGTARGGLITSIIGTALSALLYMSCFLCVAGTSCFATNCACQMAKLCDNASLTFQQKAPPAPPVQKGWKEKSK